MEVSVCAVVVTYQPNPNELLALLEALRPQVNGMMIVDNGSEMPEFLHDLAADFDAQLILLEENQGIARAQNLGIALALEQGFDAVLLSDQDSIPASDMVKQLVDCFEDPQKLTELPTPENKVASQFPRSAFNGPVAAVGPVPSDGRGDGSGGDLVYSFTKWGARRTTVPGPGEVLAAPFVLASGCLISREALKAVGPMNEALFIDHVDLAWCLRAIEKGFRILVSGDARIYHSLGDDVATVPGRKRAVHLHSPIRNYYMMRNTLLLQSASFLPAKWKRRYLWWMAKYTGYYALAPGRTQRLPMICRGIKDGLQGKSGPVS